MVASLELVLDDIRFPEGPRWHDGCLWFSDIHDHRVRKLTPDGHLGTACVLDDRPSGLGFLPDGSLLVVSMLDRAVLRVDSNGGTEVHADLSSYCDQFLNDMIVDPASGRAYVGCRNVGGGAEGPRDRIVLVDPDGSTRIAADRLQGPNGTVITPDGSALIVAETAIGRLTRFDLDDRGELTNRRTFAEIEGHHFDGICLDDLGQVWIGAGHDGLICLAEGSRVVEQIRVPGRMVIACVFGGPDREWLYLATTAPTLIDNLLRIGADRSIDRETHSVGRIMRVQVGRVGAGTP